MLLKVLEFLVSKFRKEPQLVSSPTPEIPLTKLCKGCSSVIAAKKQCPICRAPAIQYIDLNSYFMGHNLDPKYRNELTEELVQNAIELLLRVNSLLSRLVEILPEVAEPVITSGWRPAQYNAQIGGSKHSRHIICKAIDLLDPDHRIGNYLKEHPELLAEYDLAIEDPSVTSKPTGNWVHIQHGSPASGRRIFLP